MEKQTFAFFAQLESIQKTSSIFDMYKNSGIYYYYFQLDHLFYIFLYGKLESTSLDDLISPLIVIKELNTKRRRIRSIRGFLNYTLGYIRDEKEVKLIATNFRPLFWTRIKDVLKQNRKKEVLEDFLFESDIFQTEDEQPHFKKKIQDLQSQINLLRSEIDVLTQTRFEQLEPSVTNLSSVNKSTFRSLNHLSQAQKKEIFQKGFELNNESNLKLIEYYEGTTDKNSLLNDRGYSITYGSVKKDPLYIECKKKNVKT